MGIAFSVAALMLLLLAFHGGNPIVFVLASAVFFGVFGEIYSLFPATCGDTFGSKYADDERRHALHGEGHGGAARALRQRSRQGDQGWYAVFIVAVCLNAGAALIAVFLLKPMRLAFIDSTRPKSIAPPTAKPAIEAELA